MTHIHVLARIRRVRLSREGSSDLALRSGDGGTAETPAALPRQPELRSSAEPITARTSAPSLEAGSGRSAQQMRREKAISGVATGK